MPERHRETVLWIWAPPLTLAVALLALWASGANRAVFSFVNGWSAITGPVPWSVITMFGNALVLLALALPILWYRPHWAWTLLAAAVLTTIVTHTMKPWLDLPRPAAVLGPEAITIIGPELRARSMPSGHASAAFTVAGVLLAVMRGRGARTLVLVAAALVALSRVAVGAHWPADVLVGALVGWGSGMACRQLVAPRSWMTDGTARGVFALALAGCAVALPFIRTGYPGSRPIQAGVAVVSLGFALLLARGVRPPAPDPAGDLVADLAFPSTPEDR